MSKQRKTYSLREVLSLMVDLDERERFERLHDRYGSGMRVTVWGEPSRLSFEEKRYWGLRDRAVSEVLAMLKSGKLQSGRTDPREGLIPIPPESWEVLDPDFYNSTAGGGGAKFTAIRVWFRRQPQVFSARAKRDCTVWIQRLVEGDKRPSSKESLLQDAKRKFSGLSGRVFNQVWAAEVPPAWKRQGRPAKQSTGQK